MAGSLTNDQPNTTSMLSWGVTERKTFSSEVFSALQYFSALLRASFAYAACRRSTVTACEMAQIVSDQD